MPNEEIEQKLRAFLVKNFLYAQDGITLGGADSLMDRGVIDSTGVLELVGHLEKTFGIQVEDEDLVPENLDTVDNLVRFVGRKLAGAP